MGRFDNKVALITGGTSGIGFATAELMLKDMKNGAVIITGRNKERGEQAVNLLKVISSTSKVFYFSCDVSNSSEITKLKQFIVEQFNRLDYLFNNAGILLTVALDEIDDNNYKTVFDSNVKSTMLMTKEFIPLLQETKGSIVNNASVAGLHSHTEGRKAFLYASSKAAMIQFSKLCALNYAPNVRVNCICPGIIDTPIYTNRDYSRFKGIPMNRVGLPIEVANVVCFLFSDEASYLTGLVLPIDGGSSLS